MDYLKAFIVGGAICAVGQILVAKTKMGNPMILVSFVVAGAVLHALGLYQPLVDWGGAGATVPITGFGHSLAKGAIKAVREDGLLGILTGGIKATAAGVTAAIVFGYIASVCTRAGSKK